jgi:hypothetical protein
VVVAFASSLASDDFHQREIFWREKKRGHVQGMQQKKEDDRLIRLFKFKRLLKHVSYIY